MIFHPILAKAKVNCLRKKFLIKGEANIVKVLNFNWACACAGVSDVNEQGADCTFDGVNKLFWCYVNNTNCVESFQGLMYPHYNSTYEVCDSSSSNISLTWFSGEESANLSKKLKKAFGCKP